MPAYNKLSGKPTREPSGNPSAKGGCCCGGMRELIRCCDGVSSGIGLLPEHTPSGATALLDRGALATVLYQDDCYTIGDQADDLSPSRQAATLAGGCGDQVLCTSSVPLDLPDDLASSYMLSVQSPLIFPCVSYDGGSSNEEIGLWWTGGAAAPYTPLVVANPIVLAAGCVGIEGAAEGKWQHCFDTAVHALYFTRIRRTFASQGCVGTPAIVSSGPTDPNNFSFVSNNAFVVLTFIPGAPATPPSDDDPDSGSDAVPGIWQITITGSDYFYGTQYRIVFTKCTGSSPVGVYGLQNDIGFGWLQGVTLEVA